MKLEAAARIPEDRVAEILTRAAELDRDRRETITVDAIRAAALDAGISPAAVDTALAEYAQRQQVPAAGSEAGGHSRRSEESPPLLIRVRGFMGRVARAMKTPLKLGGALLVLGVAGAAGEGAMLLGGLAWLVLAVLLIRRHRPSRRARHYVLSLAVMTIGLGLGFAIGEVDEDIIGILFTFAIPLLVAGVGIIKLRLPARFRSTAGEIEASAG